MRDPHICDISTRLDDSEPGSPRVLFTAHCTCGTSLPESSDRERIRSIHAAHIVEAHREALAAASKAKLTRSQRDALHATRDHGDPYKPFRGRGMSAAGGGTVSVMSLLRRGYIDWVRPDNTYDVAEVNRYIVTEVGAAVLDAHARRGRARS